MLSSKKNSQKKVSFAPRVDTDVFIYNTFCNAHNYITDPNKQQAVAQIYKAFTAYLEQVEQNYPRLAFKDEKKTDIKEIDSRILVYYILIINLAKNQSRIPAAYKKNPLDFHISGWPVAVDDNSFTHWSVFTRLAAAAYQKEFPEANLSEWVVAPQQEPVNENALSIEEEKLPEEHPLPEVLGAEQETPVSIDLDNKYFKIKDIYRFVSSVHEAANNDLKEDEVKTKAAKKINSAFIAYLKQLEQSEFLESDFPVIEYDNNHQSVQKKLITSIDSRLVLYYVLINGLIENNHQLPTSYQHIQLDFSSSGWPVAENSPHFAQWGSFANLAAATFMSIFPQTELTAWIVPQQLDDYDFDAWQAPKELNRLTSSIKAMHAYGLQLKSTCPHKSIIAMQLAVELFNDLQHYYTLQPDKRNKDVFAAEFLNKLHAQDPLMSTHRHYWKVILLNITIALTGVGLLALGLSLLARRQGFFAETQSQSKVNEVARQFDNSFGVA